jgi:hypothetical protein
MRFSKKYATIGEWLKKVEGLKETPYQKRVIRYYAKHPYATLAETRGHKPKAEIEVLEWAPVELVMYRTSFVVKIPVAHRWKVMRRQIFSREPVLIGLELQKYLRVCGDFIHSHAYIQESAEVGIEENQEMPMNEADLGIKDDFYDAGGT